MRKIMFLISSLGGGGAEKVLVNLLSKIDYDKYEVDLVVVSGYGIYFKDIPKNVKVIVLFKNLFLVRMLTFFYVKYNINFFWKFIVRRKIVKKYDVAISFADSSYTDLLFYIKLIPKKLITWVHSSYNSYSNFSRKYRGNYKQRVINERYSRLNTLVFVSQDSFKSFQEIFGNQFNSKVIYNIIDEQQVKIKSEEYTLEKTELTKIILMGSLLPVKGYELLISAAEILKNENVSFVIEILGDGPLKNNLNQLINSKGLQKHVFLRGFKSNPYPILKSADIFCMTSLSEALPTALCEAMILGIPVCVTNCNGCSEVVDHGKYGEIVDINPNSIANGLKKLILDKDLRKKYANLSITRSKIFNEDLIMSDIYKLLD